MDGNNSINLCGAALARAVEFYLNEKVFREPVRVSNITHKDNFYAVHFTQIKDEEEEEEPDGR